MSLVVEHLRAGYGQLEILQGVSARVDAGEMVGLIGPNGAGKSTLLKTIFGYLRPFAGAITFDHQSLVGLRPDQVLHAGIGFLAQDGGLFADMTVNENLVLGGYSLRTHGDRERALDQTFTLFPLLRDRRRQRAGSLSGGEQRLLGLGRALMVRPRLLVLDEPSAALAPVFIDRVYDAIVDLNRAGLALLIAEQNVEMILGVALLVFVVAMALLAGLFAFLMLHRQGLAVRAVAQNPEAAQAMGINLARIFSLTIALGVGLAGAGGALIAPQFNVYPAVGLPLTIKAFAITILGGMGNLLGALVASLVVGVTESLAVMVIPSEWQNLIAFAVMVLVLLVRPQGLLGHAVTR